MHSAPLVSCSATRLHYSALPAALLCHSVCTTLHYSALPAALLGHSVCTTLLCQLQGCTASHRFTLERFLVSCRSRVVRTMQARHFREHLKAPFNSSAAGCCTAHNHNTGGGQAEHNGKRNELIAAPQQIALGIM